MAVEFRTLIQRNKRNSWILLSLFTFFIVVLGGLIGYAWASAYGMPTREEVYVSTLLAMTVAFLIAVLSGAASYYGGASAILAMSRARPIRKEDDPQLFNVVEEMAIAAGIPMPRIYVIDDTAPNAFATGRDPQHGVIAITTGLRQKLNRDELQGVIAHEISHIGNYDILFGVLMATLVGVVVLLCDMFLRSLAWGRWGGSSRSRRSSRDDQGGGGLIVLIVILAAIVLSIIAPILAKLIEMAFSRQREYLADASAVQLTRNPDGLASALAKVAGDPEVLEVANRATAPLYFVHPIKQFEERASSIMDSHPPIKDRIQRILSLKGAQK
ncbi:MAG TPA: M48 family metallopeptidase [Phycisphaerae bacterium]|nr:M48 family metallopeptidase [Phycisphaerae bacterium]